MTATDEIVANFVIANTNRSWFPVPQECAEIINNTAQLVTLCVISLSSAHDIGISTGNKFL